MAWVWLQFIRCSEMCWGGILIWNVHIWYLGTMLRTVVQCWGCPVTSYSAQKETIWRGWCAEKAAACQRGLKIWLFEGVKVVKIDWNFHRGILIPRPAISRGFHSPGPPAPCARARKLRWKLAVCSGSWETDLIKNPMLSSSDPLERGLYVCNSMTSHKTIELGGLK